MLRSFVDSMDMFELPLTYGLEAMPSSTIVDDSVSITWHTKENFF